MFEAEKIGKGSFASLPTSPQILLPHANISLGRCDGSNGAIMERATRIGEGDATVRSAIPPTIQLRPECRVGYSFGGCVMLV